MPQDQAWQNGFGQLNHLDMTESPNLTKSWLRGQQTASRRGVARVVWLSLVGTMAAIAQAFCAGALLAQGLAGQMPSFAIAAAFAALALLRSGLGLLAERRAFTVSTQARSRLRADALAKMLTQGPALLRAQHSAALANVLVDRVEALDGLFARWMPAAALAMAGPALVVLAALPVDPMAALILAGCGLLVPVGMALSGIGAAAASRRQFVALQRLQTRFLDRIRGIATIVLAGRTEQEAEALRTSADALRQHTMRVLRVAFLSSAVLDCAMALALVLLALRYAQGSASPNVASPNVASPGVALAMLLLAVEFFAPLRAFAAAYQDRMHAAIAAEQLAALPEIPPAGPALPVRNVTARGVTVTFEDVDLSWDATRGKALDGLSFRLPAGETLVLAGPSGAGKSSVLEILLGFIRPDRGSVRINGADIVDLVPAALSALIGWMGQRPVLFAGTIAENIRFARPEATEAEIAEAARAARLDSVTAGLPDGLDTRIGDGGHGLSGGQAQRVAIARAFLKNAPLLLLDEPTAHLDPATEAEVFDSLRRLMAGRTVILATHSAAAASFGGRRLDLRDGRAVTGRAA